MCVCVCACFHCEVHSAKISAVTFFSKSTGSEWSGQQLRSRTDARTPVSLSEDVQNIDNTDAHFHPLTLKRTIVPPNVPAARRTPVPGYTGKAAHANSAAEAAVSVPAVSSPAGSSGPAFGRAAPLSRMVTTVTPCNPFLRPALPVTREQARGQQTKQRRKF
uniref:spermatogenesis-associated protein 48-like n=1 Tax=Gasterosteus aculeatus aculeatus TaxID=481459 RepID=UPI001A99FD53|nr:spermatogenesis-associated protein 48-like [Gasterosteus aculeatus aculeatus]